MIFENPEQLPKDFVPEFEVASCFIEHEGEILMLLSQDYKHYGSAWGCPAGKLDEGEATKQAIIREVKEETGINLKDKKIEFVKKVFLRMLGKDMIYNLFYTKLEEKPEVKINDKEHKEFKWLKPSECFYLKLIPDEDLAINLLLKFLNNKT